MGGWLGVEWGGEAPEKDLPARERGPFVHALQLLEQNTFKCLFRGGEKKKTKTSKASSGRAVFLYFLLLLYVCCSFIPGDDKLEGHLESWVVNGLV